MTPALAIRLARVERAAPATPIWNTKIRTALPMMFITSAPAATSMGVRELPMARNRAALEVYMARKG